MDWSTYISNTKHRPPRALLVEALSYVRNGKDALDLGAGALNDARFLISNGYHVDIVDSSDRVAELARSLSDGSNHVATVTYGEFHYPHAKYDVVNAQYALPFHGSEGFITLIERIKSSVKPGGIFVGNFFGPNDDWAHNPSLCVLDRGQVASLFSDWEVIKLEEVQRQGSTAAGDSKFWHLINAIARKPST